MKMLTKEEKLLAFSMRLDGRTFDEIAEHIGTSRLSGKSCLSVKEWIIMSKAFDMPLEELMRMVDGNDELSQV